MKFLKIRSRHPSHDVLRKQIRTTVNTVVRFGSFTPATGILSGYREINTVEACMTSSNKSAMKKLFAENNVKTAIWCNPTNQQELTTWIDGNDLSDKKMIIKSFRGSRGRGLYLVENQQEAIEFFTRRGYGGHIVEKFYNYNREYRLHIAKDGCFYTCRKMLKTDATERWYRNDSNSVWVIEENEAFDKPSNWDVIVEQCVNALNAVGLDVGACDVRVQSRQDNGKHPDFIICEINSAPSFGDITAQKYKQKLEQLCAI